MQDESQLRFQEPSRPEDVDGVLHKAFRSLIGDAEVQPDKREAQDREFGKLTQWSLRQTHPGETVAGRRPANKKRPAIPRRQEVDDLGPMGASGQGCPTALQMGSMLFMTTPCGP